MNVKLNPGETLDNDTGEITKAGEKTADQILAEITGGVSAGEKAAVLAPNAQSQTHVEGFNRVIGAEDLEAKRAQIAAELAEVRGTDGTYANLTVSSIGQLPVTDWQLCTTTPAHDGEYEVIHPITGKIFRAEYDTMFETWSCDYQYPTWRGLRAPAS